MGRVCDEMCEILFSDRRQSFDESIERGSSLPNKSRASPYPVLHWNLNSVRSQRDRWWRALGEDWGEQRERKASEPASKSTTAFSSVQIVNCRLSLRSINYSPEHRSTFYAIILLGRNIPFGGGFEFAFQIKRIILKLPSRLIVGYTGGGGSDF